MRRLTLEDVERYSRNDIYVDDKTIKNYNQIGDVDFIVKAPYHGEKNLTITAVAIHILLRANYDKPANRRIDENYILNDFYNELYAAIRKKSPKSFYKTLSKNYELEFDSNQEIFTEYLFYRAYKIEEMAQNERDLSR